MDVKIIAIIYATVDDDTDLDDIHDELKIEIKEWKTDSDHIEFLDKIDITVVEDTH